MSRIAPLMIFLCVLCGFLCGHFSHPLKPTPAPKSLPPVKAKIQPATARSPSKDIDFGPYMVNLQRQIKRHWFPPKGDKTRYAKAKFKIKKDGALGSTITISEFSGIKRFDDAAIEAIKSASPFEALPDGSPDFVEIEFTFNYNVFQGKDQVKKSI
ncbi:MAG: TonB C-terminal domain-containing protein [Candidatus Obscuribacterales bacterium]